MAAPIADKVILPLDTGNTGKKKRTQTRVVGADTVHEDFVIPISLRSVTGVYRSDSGKHTITAAATNGTTTGFWWLQNPVASTIKVAVHKIQVIHQFSTALTVPTMPRVQCSLFTFTGTASGAAEPYAKRDSTDAAAQSTFRTASTGMTVTLGNAFWSSLPHFASGTAAWDYIIASVQEYEEPNEVGQMILRPGEGIVCWQPDAGTTADTRQFVTNICLQEFE
jgi:hypothetical protein